MKNYQDTETGQIHAFEDGVDPFKLNNRNIPTTLSELVIQKPNEDHVWFEGHWITRDAAPSNYQAPVSSVPSYNPAWISFLAPYTFVLPDNSEFSISIDQINANLYDGDKLSEAVMTLPLHAQSELSALISHDGAIAIPMSHDYPSKTKASDELNRIFCALLLGGIHTEVIGASELLNGCLHNNKSIFTFQLTSHGRIRHMQTSPDDMIKLMYPRVISFSNLKAAYVHGSAAIKAVKNFSPFFLLHGYTAMVYQNRSDALSSLWIVIEQLTSFLWQNRFLADESLHPSNMPGRRQGLKQDNRTWSTSVKHELLWQANVLSEDCFSKLFSARAQRNKLVHEGTVPDFSVIVGLWSGLTELLEVASGLSLNGMRKLTTVEYQDTGLTAKVNFDEWITLSKNLGGD